MGATVFPPRPEDRMLGLANQAQRLRSAILRVREEATSDPARIDLAEAACRAEALIETLTSARVYEQAEAREHQLRRQRGAAVPATEYGAILAVAVHQFLHPRQTLDRTCIRCRKEFQTEDRFQFVCELCHALDEWRVADGEAAQ